MTQGMVTCATVDGPQEVRALLTDHLAIHKSLGTGAEWTITHKATGCSLGWSDTRREAKKIAERAESECGDVLKRLSKLTYAERPQDRRGLDRLREVVRAA